MALYNSEAQRRLEILDEDFAHQVRGLLPHHYKRKDVRDGIGRHVTTERNLLLRVVDEIAAPLYETPPARTIRDAPESTNETLARLVEVLELDTFMQAAVGPAFACNVVHIVPVMKPDPDDPAKLVPALELITPDISDVELEHGRLVRLTYDLDTPKDDPRRRMAVDAHGWHYLDADGDVVESIGVELGRCPAVEFRLAPHHRGDYWGAKRGHKLVEATLQISRIAAHMGWVRESLNSKQLTLICESEALAAQGKIDARRPMHLAAEATEAKAVVLDLEVKGFVAEMREHAEPVLESYGLPYTAFDLDSSAGNAGNLPQSGGAQLYGRRKKIRNRQLPQARRACAPTTPSSPSTPSSSSRVSRNASSLGIFKATRRRRLRSTARKTVALLPSPVRSTAWNRSSGNTGSRSVESSRGSATRRGGISTGFDFCE